MDQKTLLKKVRKIEIRSRGLTSQVFSGHYHSAFKGRGMAFSEVREYQPGDDIRTIDWNVTARFNHPFVKVFEEERELTVMILVDVSNSGAFGTNKQLKKDLIAELCAVLAFSAIHNNDKAGVIFFSDHVEKFIPPKKGKSHILQIIRELITFEPKGNGTDLTAPLRYLTHAIRKRSTVFILSDFLDNRFEKPLRVAARKHDIVALQLYDKREHVLPDVGLVRFQDAETGELRWVDTSSLKTRRTYAKRATDHQLFIETIFRKAGVDMAMIETGESYVKPLVNLFRKRERVR